jgi:hypothetical protein
MRTLRWFSAVLFVVVATSAIATDRGPEVANVQATVSDESAATEEYLKQVRELDQQITSAEQETQALVAKTSEAQSGAMSLQVSLLAIVGLQKGVSAGLFAASLFSRVVTHIFFPITVFNVLLYLALREKAFFARYKMWLVGGFVVLVLMYGAPALAQSEQVPETDEFGAELDEAASILRTTDVERYIGILERGGVEVVKVPSFQVPGEYLLIVPEVSLKTPEYYFTLGALYLANHQPDRAAEAVAKMYEDEVRKKSKPRGVDNRFLGNGVKFLVSEGKREVAASAWTRVLGEVRDIDVLLEMSEFFNGQGMDDIAKRTFDRAGIAAKSAGELVAVARVLYDRGEEQYGGNALKAAAQAARDLQSVYLVIEEASKHKADEVVIAAGQRGIGIAREIKEQMDVVDTLRSRGQRTAAGKAFEAAVAGVGAGESRRLERLLELVDQGVAREMYPEALKAVERLAIMLGGGARAFEVEVPPALSKNVPKQDDKVLLRTLYGALQDRSGAVDKARESFESAVAQRLRKIIDTYGYEVPIRVNDYFFLRELLERTGDNAAMARLDPVYQYMETAVRSGLEKEQGASREEILKQKMAAVESAESRVESARRELAEAKAERNKRRLEFVLQTLRLFALIALGIILLGGAVYRASICAKEASSLKSFGFAGKLVESIGWVRTFTVVGVIEGLLGVVFGQAMLVLHRQQQDLEALRLERLGSRPVQSAGGAG